MEQALKGAETDSSGNVSPPDVVRSAINKDDFGREIVKGTPAGASAKIIDNLFGVPDKIVIPERYIPDTVSAVMIFPHGLFFDAWLGTRTSTMSRDVMSQIFIENERILPVAQKWCHFL